MEYGAQIQEKRDKPSSGIAYSEDDEDFEPEQSIAGKVEYLREWQQTFPWDKQVDDANKMIFGNTDFRECQSEIINATKSGRDALALIPTGGGKSLTFQLSAVTDQGVTFVVMPLLSLIEDNLNFVSDLGIPALSLSTNSMSDKKMGHLYDEIRNM